MVKRWVTGVYCEECLQKWVIIKSTQLCYVCSCKLLCAEAREGRCYSVWLAKVKEYALKYQSLSSYQSTRCTSALSAVLRVERVKRPFEHAVVPRLLFTVENKSGVWLIENNIIEMFKIFAWLPAQNFK